MDGTTLDLTTLTPEQREQIDAIVNPPVMTEEQIKEMRDAAFNGPVTAGFVWNEEKMAYVPPFPPPDDVNPYLWNETTLAWDPFPGYPHKNVE